MFLLKIRSVKKMLRFDLPSDVDLYFDFKVVTLALIGIMFFFFSSGQNTLLYIEECFPQGFVDISSDSSVNYLQNNLANLSFLGQKNDQVGAIMKYKSDLTKKQFFIPYYMQILYWIVLPLIDLIFLIKWRNDFIHPKDLYSSLISIKSGDLKNG